MGGAAEGAAEQVRTLVDYGNDLSEVFKRAFDIRFSGDQGADAIATGWATIRQSIADTNQEIEDYQATMASLTADRAVKEYWLSVAKNYGDTLRAGELRAEIKQIDKDLSKTSKDLTKAQDKNSQSLTGNTDGAIANRATLLGLVTQYQDYIQALASSGLSQEELAVKNAQLKQDFIEQATQLGYSRVEIDKYAAAFDDVTTAIGRIPRNITVDANPDPALQALNEFMAQARAAIGGGINVPVTSSADTSGVQRMIEAEIKLREGKRDAARAERAYAAANEQESAISALRGKLSEVRGYATGGYVGDGGKYEPKGIVHGGEFVFSKKAVQNLGVQNLAYAHNMAKQGKGFAGGGSVGLGGNLGGGVMQLSAYDRQLLIDINWAIQNGLSVPANAIQRAVGAGNVNSTSRSAS
jgi:ribosome-binding protein aMBF1 (putative translation factor)